MQDVVVSAPVRSGRASRITVVKSAFVNPAGSLPTRCVVP